MATTPRSPSGGSRHALWLGAAGLLVLAVGAWVAMRASPPSPPRPPSTAVGPPQVEAPPAAASGVGVERPALASKGGRPTSAPPVRREPPASVPDAVAEPPAPPPAGAVSADPFEPEEGKDPHIRTLIAVGDIQLGVVRESARIQDEAGLKQVLVRIGGDLEQRMRARQAGDPGPQAVLDTYREELGKYMEGDVELSGPGWRVGAEVGAPLPREKWWKPRAQ